jgi:hypothetical protein
MPMRARGGGVKSKGMKVGTKVQHDPGHDDQKDMNRKRVVTFATGGGVKTFSARERVPLPAQRPAGSSPQPTDLYSPKDVKVLERPSLKELERARGGKINAPETGGMGKKLPGGAGGGKGRLAKARMY